MSREHVLHKIRTALGRVAGQQPEPAPPPRIAIPDIGPDARVEMLISRVEALAGKGLDASSPEEAKDYVARLINGHSAIASNAPILRTWGITDLAGVRSGITDRQALRELCATSDFGITSAEYALAETGTLVMLSGPAEARMISLLPPVHIALVPRDRILTGLDELYTLIPNPAERSSSMVLITGPSRTADIEQILVRGVHGPGEIHIVVV